MTTTAVKVYIGISLVISCLPALAGLVVRSRGYLWSGIFLYSLSFLFLGLAVFLFGTFALLRRGAPWLLEALAKLNRILAPVASSLSHSKIVGPLVAMVIRGNFFVWFVVLLLSDQVLRALIARLVGRHGSQRNFSIVNAVDPDFTFFDSKLQENEKKASKSSKYSQSLAYTLSVASKIVYEDVGVIKHELAKDGFDVDRTFLPMAYRNVCAFIVEKDNDIYLVFRGTNPLNIQNMVTDCNIGLKEIKSSSGSPMGKVHRGFWEAMGEPATVKRDDSTLHIQLNAASLYRTVSSTIQAAVTIAKFTAFQLIHHVTDPVDSSWIGHDTDIRNHSLYAQAEQWIMDLVKTPDMSSDSAVDLQDIARPRKRLFIAGHSLGGALATIFLAKMIQSQSPLLEYFSGLYTYGQPKIGDRDFTISFDPQISSKIFHHAYNNDIITRIPPWFNYDTPPGTLVFIDTKYDITLYPPNPQTNEPVPIRSISYLHLSGLLNAQVIRRLKHESWLRIMFRILFPFFLNDHFPSDYCHSLRNGSVDLVVIGQEGLEGGKEDIQSDEEERFVGMSTTPSSLSTTTYRRYPNGSQTLYI